MFRIVPNYNHQNFKSMRPAKFFLGLLFAAAVLITFLKILFFIVMVSLFAGGLFFAGRTFWWLGTRSARRQQAFYGNHPGSLYAAEPLPRRQQAQAEPLVPFYGRQPFTVSPFARQIEVL
jgi:hypothetical protein